MAQKSKKTHIVAIALPLFLENGFKGTSIDRIVKESGVSKPTVYNHFSDKTVLLLGVLVRWIESNKPVILPIKDQAALDEFIQSRWLTDEAIQFYALVIGEGSRFPQAKQLFWDQFDQLWRKALIYVSGDGPGNISGHSGAFQQDTIDQYLDHQLLNRLRLR